MFHRLLHPHHILRGASRPVALLFAGLLLGALSLCARPASAQLAPGLRLAPGGEGMTPPSSADPEAIARALFARDPSLIGGADPSSLVLASRADLSQGSALRFEQRHEGVRVYGGEVAVRIDGQGRVRWVHSNARTWEALEASGEARVGAAEALCRLGEALGRRADWCASLSPSEVTRPVIYAPGGAEPRRAHRIELPRDMSRLETLRAFVDQESGAILMAENRVRTCTAACPPGTARAYVHEHNPVQTPERVCVSLADYLAPGATTLENEDFRILGCIDNNNCRDTMVGSVHWCDQMPTASADAAGDFTGYCFTTDTDPADPFAEVQAFYHLNRMLSVVRTVGGIPALAVQPLEVIANFRSPLDLMDPFGSLLMQFCMGATYTGGVSLHAFDNAAFAPAGGFLGFPDQDSIIMGQGSSADFGYDGDVLYHELGHAVHVSVAPELGQFVLDGFGRDPTPAGFQEAFGDFMTAMMTDDPEVGEYAGAALGMPGGIRNMEDDNRCPEQLEGESHADAPILAGALWDQLRVSTDAGQRDAFLGAAFAVLRTMGASDNYDTFTTKLAEEMRISVGAAEGDALAALFAGRGLPGCNDRVVDAASPRPRLFVGDPMASGEAPSPVQHRLELPEGAEAIRVAYASSRILGAGGFGSAPTMNALLKEGAPLAWTHGAASSSDATVSARVSVDTTGGGGSGTLVGPFDPGTYYLQLSVGGGFLLVEELTIEPTAEAPDAGAPADAGPPDAGVPADAGGGGGGGGCGCRILGSSGGRAPGVGASSAPGAGGGGLLVALLLGAAWIGRSRRRR